DERLAALDRAPREHPERRLPRARNRVRRRPDVPGLLRRVALGAGVRCADARRCYAGDPAARDCAGGEEAGPAEEAAPASEAAAAPAPIEAAPKVTASAIPSPRAT